MDTLDYELMIGNSFWCVDTTRKILFPGTLNSVKILIRKDLTDSPLTSVECVVIYEGHGYALPYENIFTNYSDAANFLGGLFSPPGTI